MKCASSSSRAIPPALEMARAIPAGAMGVSATALIAAANTDGALGTAVPSVSRSKPIAAGGKAADLRR